ncbi:MAG: hydantoinase B/oxoprolinase family protein [Chloroflexi bacterium]|nr:hydantoinase B/oxoprolinase family protein [Chloroflexota bacterium]
MDYDPITLQVLWSRLISVVDEAAAALVRTSFSTVLRESNDFACVLLDAQGNALAQSSISIPSFIRTLPRTVKHFMRYFPPETLRPGDVLLTNDPWLGTGHLPDISISKPIFRNGKLVAFSGSSGHLPDIGGKIRSPDPRELFEEGLRIMPCKMMEQGKLNEFLFFMIRNNVRVPDMVVGDFMAHVAAANTLESRLLALMDEYSIEDLTPLAQEIYQRSQRVMEESIQQKLRPGVYRHEVHADGASEEEPIIIRCAVTVGEKNIAIDFDGTTPQVSKALNVVPTYTYAYTAYGIKCLLCPDIPNNEGVFVPVEVTAPEGSILNPRFPASVGARALTGHLLPEAVMGALAPLLPEAVLAPSSSPMWGMNLTGFNKNNQKFAGLFFLNGGMGAGAHHDGNHATSFPSNLSNTPVEVMENLFPIRIEQKAIRPDTGGAGKFRGGCGQRVDVRLVSPYPMTVGFMADRTKYPGAGLQGAQPGARGSLLINGKEISPKDQLRAEPGTLFTLNTPGGAGFGDPAERDAALAERDVREGYVTPGRAKEAHRAPSRRKGPQSQ